MKRSGLQALATRWAGARRAAWCFGLLVCQSTGGCDNSNPAARPPVWPATHAGAPPVPPPDAGPGPGAAGMVPITPDASIRPDPSMQVARLSQTGLYADIARGVVAQGVLEYRPNYELWSDRAAKRRWLWLPPGTAIDTSDMDNWRFPVGSKLWKEFARDGIRLETRLLEKRSDGPDGWYRMAFLWDASQQDANAVERGERNVHGTDHDVPSQKHCDQCHQGATDTILGVSALQLSHIYPGLTLGGLSQMGRLTHPPAGANYSVPGTPIEQAALGYLHANCGHCHNPNNFLTWDKTDMVARLSVNALGSVRETPTYRSLVGVPLSKNVPGFRLRVEPGKPMISAVYARMNTRDELLGMPPLATKHVDMDGTRAVYDWIVSISPTTP